YAFKAIIKATSTQSQEYLIIIIKQQLQAKYEAGPLSVSVEPEDVIVSAIENAEDVAEHLLNLMINFAALDKVETEVIVNKVSAISKCDEISRPLAVTTLKILNSILWKEKNTQGLQTVTNRILRTTEEIGFKMPYTGRNESIVLAVLALAVIRPDPSGFQGAAFGATSYEKGIDPTIHIREEPFKKAWAAVFLPRSLRSYLGSQSLDPEYHSKIQFNFFGTTSLFALNIDSSHRNEVLNTEVVSASTENVSITTSVSHYGLGGWNTSGCEVKHRDMNYTICYCNHLTHFGVLLCCWIQDDIVFYTSVVAYFCIIFLINIVMIINVLLQIHIMKSKQQIKSKNWKQDFLHDLRSMVSLTFLLGLTWGFAFFAWGSARIFFLYVFTICNTLQ
ncbi:unnamed protein product, partial [Natator depressus]